MVWIDLYFYIENGLNWSQLLQGKWSDLIWILTWQIIWIDQYFCITNGLNWSILLHGNGLNWSRFLHDKGSELIRVVTWQLVWIDQDYCMANGLYWSRFVHGKWAELIEDIIRQTPYFWADSEENLGGSFNLREYTQNIHFHVVLQMR